MRYSTAIVPQVMVRNMYAASAAILLALVFIGLVSSTAYAQDPDPGCGDLKGGLLQDCGFVDFYGLEGAGSGVWKIFKLSGAAGIALHPSDAWPKGPAVWVKGNAPFDAGIYQQVAVEPGKGYHFTLPYAVVNLDGRGWSEDNQVSRRLGIDGYGGTDPNSPNVKWTPDYYGKAKVTESIDLDEYAHSGTMTVFIRVINPYTDKNVDVFIDTPALIENTSMAPIQVAAPTVTPPPPPPTAVPPTPVPPTAVVEVVASPTQEPTAEPLPTDLPPATEEPAIEPTVTPSAVPEHPQPTRVAQSDPPTRPARTRVAIAQSSNSSSGAQGQGLSTFQVGVIGVVGVFGILIAGGMVALAAVLLLRRK